MAQTNLPKNKAGYGYKYTELSQINEYLESVGISYYQYIQTDDVGNDYVYTVPIIDGEEKTARRGCKIVNAPLSGKSNPAQEQGSAITYARRYSLLMAFGLATEDDDAESLTVKQAPAQKQTKQQEKNVENELVSKDELNIMGTVLADKGIDEGFVYELYKISGADKVTRRIYANIMKNVDGIKVKQEEAKAAGRIFAANK